MMAKLWDSSGSGTTSVLTFHDVFPMFPGLQCCAEKRKKLFSLSLSPELAGQDPSAQKAASRKKSKDAVDSVLRVDYRTNLQKDTFTTASTTNVADEKQAKKDTFLPIQPQHTPTNTDKKPTIDRPINQQTKATNEP